MKKRLIRHSFNMVEIALALAVLAIGISSILVLFPVGINANRSAIADNNLADISEFLMGYLRAGCAAEWSAIAEKKAEGKTISPSDYFFTSKVATEYSGISTAGDSVGIDPESSDYEDDTGNTRRISSNLYQVLTSGDINSIFLYKQTTGDIVDFAAVVKVWREDPDFRIRNVASNGITSIPTPSAMRPYATVLCIEISWPAQAPYAQREKRLFRQEIFNEAFRY